jgi:protocatechuate 3,4-dioxygenase beta subunit
MKARLALLSAIILTSVVALAENVSGVVRDEQGAPIPGAQVTLADSDHSQNPLSTTSDAHGAYHFPSVPAGTYHLQASLSGFATGRQAASPSLLLRPT